MIDWDEIDWKRGVATIVLGILLIAGGIFVLNDYLSSKRISSAQAGNLADLNAYVQKYPPPAVKDSSKLEEEIKDLEAKLAASKKQLPESYDAEAIQADIATRAREQLVNLQSVEPQPADSRGFLITHPFLVTFGGTRDQVTGFLHSLERMPYLHKIEGTKISFSDKMSITISLVSFDRETWMSASPCPEIIPLPPMKEVEVQSVRLFKDNLAQTQEQTETKRAELEKALASAQKICDLNRQKGILADKLQTLNSPLE